MHDLPTEPQSLDRSRREILDKDIRATRHLLNQSEPAFRFEVDGDRFLIGVVDHEIIGVGTRRRPAAERPARFASFGVLHFDNFGAEPGERLGTRGTGLEL